MSIFAVLMSTIDSLSFISAITFGRDILWRINSDNKKTLVISYIKLGLVISSIISLLLAYYIPSVVGLLFTLGSLIIPSLILPFIISLTIKNFNSPEKYSIQWLDLLEIERAILLSTWKVVGQFLRRFPSLFYLS